MKRLILAMLLVGCTTAPVTPSGPGVWKYDEISKYALETYGQDLLKAEPSDLRDWCPNPSNRVLFYTALMNALAKFESNYNEKETYVEKDIFDKNGKNVISAGLLQISLESGKSYGCPITKTEDLFDPAVNIACFVRIARRWVVNDGVIQGGHVDAWRGLARYFSPFRKPDRILSIKTATRKVCQ